MIIKHDPDTILGFLVDASNLQGGHATSLYLPENEEDVRQAVRDAAREGGGLTVSGAGTGLAGGRVPYGGSLLSTARMNRIVSIDQDKRRAVVEPGVILSTLQQEVEHCGLLYPPDPTETSCFIGGTVATNASGARTFKYGPTRDYVERLRLVLADGEVVDLRRGETRATDGVITLRSVGGRDIVLTVPEYVMPRTKHAAGYFTGPDVEAIDLFIGSEGTLGVITEIELRLIPQPDRLFSGVVFFSNESATLAFVEEARHRSRTTRAGLDNPTPDDDIEARALEYIDSNALELVRPNFPTIPASAPGGAVWFEQESTIDSEEHLLQLWYDMMLEHGALVDESWFGIGIEDQRRMRLFRHAVPEAVYEYITDHHQQKLGTDMAVPDDRFAELLGFYRQCFRDNDLYVVTYGHIGNSHIHSNILCRSPDEYNRARSVYDSLVLKAIDLGGTVSAEHGVGKIKIEYLEAMYGSTAINTMRRLKEQIDPNWLFGRGTMFDRQSK